MEATRDPKRRAWWLKTLHRWHWISAAVCLFAMLLFSVTGITLNHAGRIEATPSVRTDVRELPEALRTALEGRDGESELPAELVRWIQSQWPVRIDGRKVEWANGEIYVSMPRPGGDGWIAVDTVTGEATWESTDRGWIAWLNDLHKGRNAGPWWSWFIDLFAVACVLFSLTGLFLLQMHARQRPSTWPVVGLGVLLPALIALLLIH